MLERELAQARMQETAAAMMKMGRRILPPGEYIEGQEPLQPSNADEFYEAALQRQEALKQVISQNAQALRAYQAELRALESRPSP